MGLPLALRPRRILLTGRPVVGPVRSSGLHDRERLQSPGCRLGGGLPAGTYYKRFGGCVLVFCCRRCFVAVASVGGCRADRKGPVRVVPPSSFFFVVAVWGSHSPALGAAMHDRKRR